MSGEGGGVMDIGEGMCYSECCEVCKPGKSQTCTPWAINTLYVNKKLKNKKVGKIIKNFFTLTLKSIQSC